MADFIRLYSKKPETAEQRLANLLSEVMYESAYIRWRVSRWENEKRIQQRLYPFFFRSVTAVFPFCSISKTVNQFQSDAIYQAEKARRGS